jgi:galactoside O-acetyltransferase
MLQSKYLTEDDLKDFGFKSIGKNVRISTDARIYGQQNISIGNNVRIDDFVTLSASNGYIHIGSFVLIARGCHLSGPMGIVLNDFCGLAANNVIYSASDDFSGEYLTGQTLPKEYIKLSGGEVHLGKHVNTGSSVTFLGPCKIGEGSCIGANSLVIKDLDSWGMYVGSPVKRLKDRKKGLLELEKKFLESLKQK